MSKYSRDYEFTKKNLTQEEAGLFECFSEVMSYPAVADFIDMLMDYATQCKRNKELSDELHYLHRAINKLELQKQIKEEVEKQKQLDYEEIPF